MVRTTTRPTTRPLMEERVDEFSLNASEPYSRLADVEFPSNKKQ